MVSLLVCDLPMSTCFRTYDISTSGNIFVFILYTLNESLKYFFLSSMNFFHRLRSVL